MSVTNLPAGPASVELLERLAAQVAALTEKVADQDRQLAELREEHAVTRRQMLSLVPQARAEEEEEMRAFLQEKFVPFEEVMAALERPAGGD